MVARVGVKTVHYGTAITPCVVKDILGALPKKEFLLSPPSLLDTQQKLSYLKTSQFLENITNAESGRYPSVSTVLGCTTSQHLLYRWQLKMIKQLGGLGALKKYMRVRMQSGTQYHCCIQRILEELRKRGSFPDDVAEQMTSEVDSSVASYLNSVLPILRTLDSKNMELERPTSHHGLCYSGRFDAAVTYKDALFLMDWKTASSGSTKDACTGIEKMYNDPVQVAAYVGAVNSDPNFKMLPEIRFGAIVVAKENGSIADVVEMNSCHLEIYWNKWLDCVWQFWTKMETVSAVNNVISFVWDSEKKDHIVSHLSKPGDWCVRSSGTNAKRLLFVVTKVDEKNVRELKLVYKENLKGWTLVDMTNTNTNDELIMYGSIVELLSNESSFCQKMNLRNPINRPNYLLNDENLTMTDIKLGEGHYAEVFKGTLKIGTEEITVAVKRCLQIDKVSITRERPAEDFIKIKLAKSQMIAEARLVCDFMHENIIKIYGVACNFAPVKVVMEYCPGGSLKNLLVKHKETIKNEERNIFLYEAAKALRHLQLKKCVHRWDVAARNCLIGINGSLKLSDFGLSRRLEDLKNLSSDDKNIAWPIPWMAPETLSRRPKFTTKSDVYAFGVLIYEVYSCGGKPWPDIAMVQDIIPLVREGKIMTTPSLLNDKNVKEIMHQCWKRKAVQRPDFIEIVKRLRTVLQSQKLLTGPERIINMIDGIDSSKNSINLEEKSPDSVLAKQREMDDKATQKLRETTEETSAILTRGEARASAPTLEIYKRNLEAKERKSSVVRATASDEVGKWNRRSSLPTSVKHGTSSDISSNRYSRKWKKSLAFRRKTRLHRYKNQSK